MLTTREKQILKLLIKGFTNKEISNQLGIKESTVKVYNHSIFNKLNVKNRVHVIINKERLKRLC